MVESLRDAVRILSGGRDVLGEYLAECSGEGKQEEGSHEYFLTDRVELSTLVHVAHALECELELTFRSKDGQMLKVGLKLD